MRCERNWSAGANQLILNYGKNEAKFFGHAVHFISVVYCQNKISITRPPPTKIILKMHAHQLVTRKEKRKKKKKKKGEKSLRTFGWSCTKISNLLSD